MGFRSTFITSHEFDTWPLWFKTKWEHAVHFPTENWKEIGPISSKYESKVYLGWTELASDIQQCMKELQEERSRITDRTPIVLVFLHECGGITRVEIHRDDIFWTEPTGWKLVEEGGEHDYCYGCSRAIWEEREA